MQYLRDNVGVLEASNDGTTWVPVLSDGVSDHTLLSNIGTNTHAQIDTGLAKLTAHLAVKVCATENTTLTLDDLTGQFIASNYGAGLAHIYLPATTGFTQPMPVFVGSMQDGGSGFHLHPDALACIYLAEEGGGEDGQALLIPGKGSVFMVGYDDEWFVVQAHGTITFVV